jgi:hypothetical protein
MADLLKASIGVEFKGQAGINQAAAAIGKTEVALKKMAPASGQATAALINLGRVAQDAPYGIIGIANNLNPLLESFQRTAKEAGSFGGALKALGASLLGGGGLGLLLSVATGAMSYFAMGSRKAKDEVDLQKEAVDKAAEAQRKFNSAVDAASSAIVNQSDKLLDLKGILIDTGTQLNELSKQTINQAVTQYLFTQKRELLEQLIGERIKGQLATGEKLLKTAKNFQLTGNESFGRDTEVKLENLNRLAEVLGVTFSKVFNQTFNKGANNDLKKWEEQFANASIKFKKPIFIEGRIFDFNAAQEGTDLLKKLEYAFSDRLKSMEKLVVKPNIRLSQEVLDNIKIQEWLAKLPETLNKTIADGVKNIKIDALTGLGDAIGSAFSGGDLKSIFGNFLSVLGSGVQAIGKQIITLAVTAEALKKALSNIFKNPAGALIAGIGLVAVGSAIKNIAQKGIAGARALGGPVGAGRSYLVGERGPELFTPGVSGNIIPNGRLGSVSNSFGGMQVQGVLTGRGNDLLAIINSTGRSNGRLV